MPLREIMREQNVNFRGGGKGFGDAEAVELLGDSFDGRGDRWVRV